MLSLPSQPQLNQLQQLQSELQVQAADLAQPRQLLLHLVQLLLLLQSCLPYCLIKVHYSETVTSVEGGKGGLVSWGRSEVKEVRRVVASSAILKVRD
jgi:hypothetical protein